MTTPDVFVKRSGISDRRLDDFLSKFDASNVGSSCIYATGSMARREANDHSDIDLFIIDSADESRGELRMSQLDSTLLKADLIKASRDAKFPPFTGDGIHLQVHSLSDLIKRTGTPQDDASNTFTARLLLMLESRLIANPQANTIALNQVVDNYWTDFPQNDQSFLPVFLVNDVMRYWKTLCLNYESGRLGGMPSGYEAAGWKRRNRLRNIKLKFSRLWMCHATIAYLLWKSQDGRPVTPDDALEMAQLTPFARLDAIREDTGSKQVSQVIDNYSWFLERFAGSRAESLEIVGNTESWIEARVRGSDFADSMADLLSELGQESALYRFLLV